jgi:hypothetical protein
VKQVARILGFFFFFWYLDGCMGKQYLLHSNIEGRVINIDVLQDKQLLTNKTSGAGREFLGNKRQTQLGRSCNKVTGMTDTVTLAAPFAATGPV